MFCFGSQGQMKTDNIAIFFYLLQVDFFNMPLTTETKHVANNDFFNELQTKPLIINTSRGEVIETTSLITALQQNKISGAALDALAVAVCHHFQNGATSTATKTKKAKGWDDFIKNNPEKVKKK